MYTYVVVLHHVPPYEFITIDLRHIADGGGISLEERTKNEKFYVAMAIPNKVHVEIIAIRFVTGCLHYCRDKIRLQMLYSLLRYVNCTDNYRVR